MHAFAKYYTLIVLVLIWDWVGIDVKTDICAGVDIISRCISICALLNLHLCSFWLHECVHKWQTAVHYEYQNITFIIVKLKRPVYFRSFVFLFKDNVYSVSISDRQDTRSLVPVSLLSVRRNTAGNGKYDTCHIYQLLLYTIKWKTSYIASTLLV